MSEDHSGTPPRACGGTPRPITASWWLAHGALADCPDFLKFRKAFPDGMALTPADLRRYAEARISVDWLAWQLGPETWRRYRAATREARQAYRRAGAEGLIRALAL